MARRHPLPKCSTSRVSYQIAAPPPPSLPISTVVSPLHHHNQACKRGEILRTQTDKIILLEQESLITTLAAQNEARNASFARLLPLLPLLASVPFLLGLLLPPRSPSPSPTETTTSPPSAPRPSSSSSSSPSALLSLLALSSLLATGLLLARLGPTQTGFARLDGVRPAPAPAPAAAHGRGSGTATATTTTMTSRLRGWRRGRGGPGGILGDDGGGRGQGSPLERYLPYLNLVLAGLAFATGLLEQARRAGAGPAAPGVSPVLLGALPGVVYAAVVGAKVVMAGVDPEKELSGLRYGYKGA